MRSATTNTDLIADGPAPAAARAAGLLRRFAFGMAGEAMQSAFHFAVNLALLRVLAPAEYGLFAIVFTLGSLANTYATALVATPATVLMPRCRRPAAIHLHDVVFGSVAVLVAACGGGLVGVGLAATGSSLPVAVAGTCFVAAWALRTYVRAALYARREPGRVAGADLAFTITGLVAGAACLAWGQGSDPARLAAALAVLAVANAAGIAAALLGTGRRVRLSFGPRVRRRYRRHWPMLSWSVVGITTSNIQSQFQTFLVAAFAGPAAYAPIAAALVLLAPLRLAVGALIAMVQPDFAADLAAGRGREVAALLRWSAGFVAAASLAYGLALWLGFDLVRAHVFAGRFADEPLGLIVGLAWAISAGYLSYMLPKALLEAAGDFRGVATATLVSALVGIVCVSVLLLVTSAAWSLAGVIAAELVTLLHFWTGTFRLLRRRYRPA